MLGEDFGEVQALHGADIAIQPALDLHEAARVVADHVLGLRLEDGVAFHLGHRGGDLREFHRERSAETAARFRLAHLDEFQPLHFAEQLARRRFGAEFAQAVAAIVESDRPLETRADIADAELIDEELGELVSLRRKRLRRRFLRRGRGKAPGRTP